MAITREDVLTYLEESNMIEISELISEIEEKFKKLTPENAKNNN